MEARPVPGTPAEAVRHLYLDHVLPRLLAGAGKTVLHASAVEIDGVAIVFAGESGSGKSTLAASFCSAGARLLSDDAVLLDRNFRVIPSYPVHRLWPSSASVLTPAADSRSSSKRRLGPARSEWSSAPAQLAAIYLLTAEGWQSSAQGREDRPNEVKGEKPGPSRETGRGRKVGSREVNSHGSFDSANSPPSAKAFASLRQPSKAFASLRAPTISTSPGSAAMLSLVRQSYRLDPSDHANAAAEFRLLARLAESVPPGNLAHSRRLQELPALRKKIMQNLHQKFQRRDAFGV